MNVLNTQIEHRKLFKNTFVPSKHGQDKVENTYKRSKLVNSR